MCQGPRRDALKSGFCGVEKKDPTEIEDEKCRIAPAMEPDDGECAHTLHRLNRETEVFWLGRPTIPTIRLGNGVGLEESLTKLPLPNDY